MLAASTGLSQTVLCPKSLNSFVADKLAALGLSHRLYEGRLFITTHRNWGKIVLLRKLQY
jgi:hypothetical protein